MWRIAIYVTTILSCSPAQAELFPRPEALQRKIEFWTKVYSEWDSQDVIFFNRDDIRQIYLRVRMSEFEQYNFSGRYELFSALKQEIGEALKHLDKTHPKSDEKLLGIEKDVYNQLENIVDVNKYKNQENVYILSGKRDIFDDAMENAELYGAEITRGLVDNDLPRELFALIFVESSFHLKAQSSAGAGGIWQLMPSVARQKIRVNRLVDERQDPVWATKAAAAYLKHAKAALADWPLVITSFNQGIARMRRARARFPDADIAEIIDRFEEDSFGFAGKNYYAQFLATLDLYNHAGEKCSDATLISPWEYEVVTLPRSMFLSDLSSTGKFDDGVDFEVLKNNNPGLTKHALKNNEVLPKGFALRIPRGTKEAFTRQFASLSKRRQRDALCQVRVKHRANGHETLLSIAERYDVEAHKLARELGMWPMSIPKAGTIIRLRSADSDFSKLSPENYFLP